MVKAGVWKPCVPFSVVPSFLPCYFQAGGIVHQLDQFAGNDRHSNRHSERLIELWQPILVTLWWPVAFAQIDLFTNNLHFNSWSFECLDSWQRFHLFCRSWPVVQKDLFIGIFLLYKKPCATKTYSTITGIFISGNLVCLFLQLHMT